MGRLPKSRRNKILAAVVIVAIALVVGIPAFTSVLGGLGGYGLVPTSNMVSIVNGQFRVDSGTYESYQFAVPSGVTDVRLEGSFSATGGSGTGVEVLIMDPVAYAGWQSGHEVNFYYDSGPMAGAYFDTPLPSHGGTYYLVYSNALQHGNVNVTVSQKDVDTRVYLIYTA
jgi:hypothetical protein